MFPRLFVPGERKVLELSFLFTKVLHRDFSFLGTKGLGNEKSVIPRRQVRAWTMACCVSVPYFVPSDRELYAVDSADDLLMYDRDSDVDDDGDDEHNVLRKCLTLLGDADDRPVPVTARLGAGVDGDSAESFAGGPLLKDCMWSAGMLPPDLKATRPGADCPAAAALTAAEDVDAMCAAAVDPSLVSPCPHVSHQPVTSSPGARHVTLTPPSTDPGIKYCLYFFNRVKKAKFDHSVFLVLLPNVARGPYVEIL